MKNAQPASLAKLLLSMLIAALIISVAILSWVPPVSRDALTHHLAVPKLYLEHGGIYEIPAIIFSYYPMNLDLLYMIPLYWGNDIAAKFIHFLFALLTAWLLYGYLRTRLNTGWALFGVLFFLSLPIIVKLSITVYVDLGLVFFSTASLLSFLKWIESRFRLKYLLLSAVSCGLALGTKYNGLVVFFILAVFVPLVYIRANRNPELRNNTSKIARPANFQAKAVGWAAVFCAVTLLVFSPWMIRNHAWTGNPVYPLYNKLFNPPRTVAADTMPDGEERILGKEPVHTGKQKSTRWSSFAIRRVVFNESWWEIAIIPIRIFFQGQDDSPRYFDGQLNPALFLLPFFAFWLINKNAPALKTEKKIWAWFSILVVLYAYFQTDMRIRYIAPVLPPLVILATFGLAQIFTGISGRLPPGSQWMSAAAIAILAAAIFTLNLAYIVRQFQFVAPFSYISKTVDRDSYIARYRPEHTIYRYANTHLPAEVKILGIFLGNRRYYCEKDIRFDNNLLRQMIKNAADAPALFAQLQRKGFTHLAIRFDLFDEWANSQFDDTEKEMIGAFSRRYLKKLIIKDGYGLFELNRLI